MNVGRLTRIIIRVRNNVIFENLATATCDTGYQRSAKQCQTKIKYL